jgi:2-dehydropantoate 2-reductase
MRITIIGTGGVGGYFGARMAKAGNEVTFIARGKHLEAMKSNGLQVKSINGDFHLAQVNATSDIEKSGRADLVVLAVKAWQLREVGPLLKAIAHEDTLVLPLQNGVLASDELKAFVPVENVLSGLCRIISFIEAPGVISHVAVEPTIVFGLPDNSQRERLLELQALFTSSGIKSKLAEDIESELWKKFIIICASGLLAVTRSTYGEVRECEETREMMHLLHTEVANVGRALGVNIEADFVSKIMDLVDSYPYNSTASLTRDVWEGKPSELEYQNGTVVRLAEKAGVDVPVNRFIYHALLLMEKKARQSK